MTTSRIPSQTPSTKTASGLVCGGPCIFQGFVLGTDGTNDPTITLYNNVAASGQEVVPTTTYDASALGLNGATGFHQWCDTGLYIAITCAGTVEVSVQYIPYYYDTALGRYMPDKDLRLL